MLRYILYKIKSLVQRNTGLYRIIYILITFNFDYFKQSFNADKYLSKFGGMWTDRTDYDQICCKKLRNGTLSNQRKTQLDEWRKEGRILIPGAIPHELIDQYMADIDEQKTRSPSNLLITATNLGKPLPYTAENAVSNQSVRIVDDYFISDSSRQLLFHPTIIDFIQDVFNAKPVLTQSLRFDYGSEQEIHQDTVFVRMNAPMKLAAVWVALENIEPGMGELIYYPGSHRWEGYLFSERFKHYDEERDGQKQLVAWHKWIHEEAKCRQVVTESFIAKKGDLLIWHAGLAHGGSKVTKNNKTRYSLVGHYCPEGVRPLYHYYKPAQRKFYSYKDYKYCSSYYR